MSLNCPYTNWDYLSGLIGNLRSCAPDMFKFFCYLKDRAPHVPLSPEEKKIASGKIKLSSNKLAEIMQCQDAYQMSLQNAFLRQQEKARVSDVSLMQSFSFHRRLGTLGPGKVQTAVNQVDCRIGSTI